MWFHNFMRKRSVSQIAVPFSDQTTPAMISRAQKNGMSIAELRVDLYSSYEIKHVLKEILKFKKISTIATIRSKKEGGAWKGTEKERLKLFKIVLPHVDKIDIELSSRSILKEVIANAHRLKKTVIVSYHNFQKTPKPAFLTNILKKSKAAGADIVKIAVMARSKKDVEAMAEFTSTHAREGLITLSMGKEGVLSRVLFPCLGSLLTFAHIGRSTAPGQMDLKTTSTLLKNLYS